jgi:hypothetical protein
MKATTSLFRFRLCFAFPKTAPSIYIEPIQGITLFT